MDAYYQRADSLFLEKFSPDTRREIPCSIAQGIRLEAIESAR
jgi:hypothetical protein